MHICFITHEYPKTGFSHGGIGTFVKTFSRQLVEKGHEVSVVGINNYTLQNEVEHDLGVTVYRLKPKRIKGLTWFFNTNSINNKIKKINANSPIDIVESSELGLAFTRKLKNIKYIIRLHGGHHFFAESEERGINKWKGFQEKRSFKKADAFIAVSDYVKTHTEQYLSYDNKLVVTIKNAVNLDVFQPKTNVEIENHSLLFAGTVCEKKGVGQLVKAMPKVLKYNPNVKLYLYGRDWKLKDGRSYIDYVKHDIMKPQSLDERQIKFMGVVPLAKLAKAYAKAQICIFPSLMETQGLVAPEAMAMQRLVIFSDKGPGPETITHGKTGLLCNPYNPEDIADKIIWALNNKSESEKIAFEGYKFVMKNFNNQTITLQNLNFYESIIK
ncbi:glycosyltransferase family 4 protein [Winogradskyella sp.]|uniref:glycosyltransferase family 4 protein n=1 Tax=Winogradskyella sp. TaxID=1883156 RepID=UPI00263A1532|nr:glycosyltransferase family 4 protein [Winogradskyella sp.]